MPNNIVHRAYNAHKREMKIKTNNAIHNVMAVVLTVIFCVLLFGKALHYHEEGSCSHQCSSTEKCYEDCNICKLIATPFTFHEFDEVKFFVTVVETEYKEFVCDAVICSNEVTSLRAPPHRA